MIAIYRRKQSIICVFACNILISYHLTFFSSALFFPFAKVLHHCDLDFRIIVLITVFLVLHAFFCDLLLSVGVHSHVDRFRPANPLDVCWLALLLNREPHLSHMLYFGLQALCMEGRSGEHGFIDALNSQVQRLRNQNKS